MKRKKWIRRKKAHMHTHRTNERANRAETFARSKQWLNSLNFVENDIVAYTFFSRSLSRCMCVCVCVVSTLLSSSFRWYLYKIIFDMRARANNERKANNKTAAALKTTIKGKNIVLLFHGMCPSYCVNAPYCLIAFSVLHRNTFAKSQSLTIGLFPLVHVTFARYYLYYFFFVFSFHSP